jgi:hypothetical protein
VASGMLVYLSSAFVMVLSKVNGLSAFVMLTIFVRTVL